MKHLTPALAAALTAWLQTPSQAHAQAGTEAQLAQQLSNPIADLISLPLQLNYDENIGVAGEGSRYTLNVQPVIPISLNADWNVISRTIVPLTYQDDISPGAGSQEGLGDILQSLFFSPKEPTANGWVWGVGPAFGLPTATDELLGTEKWLLGPTAVALRVDGPLTYGALANHLWSVAGTDARSDVNQTFLQPFFAYTTPTAYTFTVNSESSYNWETEEWSIPINLLASKLVTIGKQPVSFALGARYWADTPDTGAEDWGLRFVVTLIYPK
ncbi:MAG: transporter [Pseudomonadota bacterium]